MESTRELLELSQAEAAARLDLAGQVRTPLPRIAAVGTA